MIRLNRWSFGGFFVILFQDSQKDYAYFSIQSHTNVELFFWQIEIMRFNKTMKQKETKRENTVRIPDELYDKLVERKALTKLPIQSQVEISLTEYFEKHQSLESRKWR